jgi:hypothetical protein
VTASRIPSSSSYQEHWPSILSHNRSAQERSESSKDDFGQTFREQLSTGDETSAPAKLVPVPQNPSSNEKTAGQPVIASEGAPEKAQRAIEQTALNNVASAKLPTLPTGLTQVKAPSRAKTATGINDTSSAGKEPGKISSRNKPESGDPQAEGPDLPLNGPQIALLLPHRDDADSEADDAERPTAEIHGSNQVDGTDAASSTDQISGDLAIGMRINPTNSDTSEMQGKSGSVEGTTAQNTAGFHNQVQMAATVEPQHRHEADASTGTGAIAATQAGVSSQTEKASQTAEEDKSTHSADFETELNKFRNEPVRGAHVQIADAENQRVDIRLQERGGTLSVTVRSSDSTLARTLQDHAPELNARLSAEHFRTELWTPSSNKSPQERSGGNGGQGQEQGEAAQREQSQGQKRRQDQEPEWIAEFENHPAAFQKRIDYTWHQ